MNDRLYALSALMAEGARMYPPMNTEELKSCLKSWDRLKNQMPDDEAFGESLKPYESRMIRREAVIMSMETLDEIGVRCGTDKSSRFHNYLEYYHDLFSPIRFLPIKFLELGVDGGESIKMWSEFFPSATIHGVDIHDKKGDLGRGTFILGDATQPNFIHDLSQFGPFDVILDDASHYSDQQKTSLRLLWLHVKPGGMYLIEDCHSSWHYPWTIPDEVSFVHSMIDWIDSCMEKGAGHCGKPTETDVEEIVFRKSLTVLKKRCL